MKEPTEHIVEELEAKDCNVYGNAQTARAKMKEIQKETAKDSWLMRVARYYWRMTYMKRSNSSRC